MRPEHRHELKTNELAQWLVDFPQWARKNLATIIYVVVLIAVVAGYIWIRYGRNVVSVKKELKLTALLSRLSRSKTDILRARAQGVDISYILLQPANMLEAFAQNTKEDAMAALALIKRAEALRAELHYRQGPISKQDFTSQMNLAKESYNKALARLAHASASGISNPSLTAMAKFGLGLCEEEVGKFDKAKQIYRDIIANPDFKPTIAAAQAKLRLDTISDYRKKIAFKAPPKPTPANSIKPQIALQPLDINLPQIKPKIAGVNLPPRKLKTTDSNPPSQ